MRWMLRTVGAMQKMPSGDEARLFWARERKNGEVRREYGREKYVRQVTTSKSRFSRRRLTAIRATSGESDNSA